MDTNEKILRGVLNVIHRVNTKVLNKEEVGGSGPKDGLKDFNLLTGRIIVNNVRNYVGSL